MLSLSSAILGIAALLSLAATRQRSHQRWRLCLLGICWRHLQDALKLSRSNVPLAEQRLDTAQRTISERRSDALLAQLHAASRQSFLKLINRQKISFHINPLQSLIGVSIAQECNVALVALITLHSAKSRFSALQEPKSRQKAPKHGKKERQNTASVKSYQVVAAFYGDNYRLLPIIGTYSNLSLLLLVALRMCYTVSTVINLSRSYQL